MENKDKIWEVKLRKRYIKRYKNNFQAELIIIFKNCEKNGSNNMFRFGNRKNERKRN
jgi:hypothetical protein